MPPSWSSTTVVKYLLQGAGTPLTDAQIEEELYQAEAYVTNLIKLPTTFTFDVTKPRHRLLRDYVAKRAALAMILAAPASFQTLSQASIAADICAYFMEQDVALLAKDRSAADFIQSST